MENKKEEWKSIKGYEGLYEVSSFGRVRSLNHLEVVPSRWGRLIKRWKKGRVLTPRERAHGYVAVSFSFRGKDQPIHHLVAEAFIGKRPKNYQINHKDGDKKNNNFENLEWVTCKENLRHARERGLSRSNKGKKWKHLTFSKINEIRILWEREKLSQKKIAKKMGVSSATIMRVTKGLTFKKYA